MVQWLRPGSQINAVEWVYALKDKATASSVVPVYGSCTVELEFEFPNWVQAKATSDCLVGGGQPSLTRQSEVAFFPPLIYICQKLGWPPATRQSEVVFAWIQFANSNSTSSNLKTHPYLIREEQYIKPYWSYSHAERLVPDGVLVGFPAGIHRGQHLCVCAGVGILAATAALCRSLLYSRIVSLWWLLCKTLSKLKNRKYVRGHWHRRIQGRQGHAPSPVQFLSFSCSFRQKSCRIIGIQSPAQTHGWYSP